MNSPTEILKKYWGYEEFRHPQKEIISNVLENKDIVALLPTGGGKSICFQIPALIKQGVCVVISPLIALMNDQVNNLQKRNIKAMTLSSKLSQDEIVTAFDNLQFGNYKFLYLSPEKLQSDFIQEKLKQLNVQLIAIDEAHCISEWGHDFRPSYLNIHYLREIHPDVPIIALTASATKKVISDITTSLELRKPKIFQKSFFRKNLAYQIFEVEDKLFKVEQILNKIKGSTIIYTNTRRKTIEVSNQLNILGFNSNYYHGGMLLDEKTKAYENWLDETTPIIVATNAFGMGIDKSNVRVVIHLNLPQSVENYIQEAGRGGRDEKKAFSVVLKNKSDIYDAKKLLSNTLATTKFIKSIYFKLNQYYQIAYGEFLEKNYDFNITDFCNLYKFPIVKTYNALKILDRENILLLDENFDRKSAVKFCTSSNLVFDYCDKNPSKNDLIKLILRTYGGVFDSNKVINETYLSKSLNISVEKVKQQLKALHKDKIIYFHDTKNNTQIRFLVPREDDRTINSISKNIEQRNLLRIRKMNSLIDFIENDKICRSQQLLAYFDQFDSNTCGICDVCIAKKHTLKNYNTNETSEIIIDLIKKNSELSSKEILRILKLPEKDVLFSLKLLLEKNIIAVNSQNKYTSVNL
ncbi:RecQ family ATP-dependent DNA helicase [Urechidicola croceus]|uniref:ATP-dependent DNA helicase RecQ n=1 Tax=Urechidicola croceus TaxID=1850246 RepID=A0A1D8P4Q7_9FLAO|nr:RecQ family ATP-dependent DNA helicase [Urechidicola croceus]AOW19553.1 hypothetical protein LPB138_02160 [Urechidicola croceus]